MRSLHAFARANPRWVYTYQFARHLEAPPAGFGGLTDADADTIKQAPEDVKETRIGHVERELGAWPDYGLVDVGVDFGVFDTAGSYEGGHYLGLEPSQRRFAAQRELLYAVFNDAVCREDGLDRRHGAVADVEASARNKRWHTRWYQRVRTSQWGRFVSEEYGNQPEVAVPSGLQVLVLLETQATLRAFLTNPVSFLARVQQVEDGLSDPNSKGYGNLAKVEPAKEAELRQKLGNEDLEVVFDQPGTAGQGCFFPSNST